MLATPTVGVIGGGSWGTALALAAHRAGSRVTLATRNKNVISSVEQHRINDIYLPHVFIDPAVKVTDDLRLACDNEILILAVPSQCMRSACISISDLLDTRVPIILGSKGLEKGSLLLMNEVVSSVLPKNSISIISGPNFASEVARGKPSATTLASPDADIGKRLVYAIGSKYFRPYLSDDIVGAQIGGTVKNIIAIACGIAFGNDLGENARSALITRGFAEMVRLCVAKGGRADTLMGLAGLGDLILTCSSMHSRNTSFGLALSKGTPVNEVVVNEGRGVIEGASSVESVVKLARKLRVEMPICEAVYRVLHENASIADTIDILLDRPFSSELGAAIKMA
jgi:glycerol-3-phosphate dehydrogenase (NAD(P)+)